MGRTPMRTKHLPIVVSNAKLGALLVELVEGIGARFKVPVSVSIYEHGQIRDILHRYTNVFLCETQDGEKVHSFERLCTEFDFNYQRQRIKSFDALLSLSVKPYKYVDFNFLTELCHVLETGTEETLYRNKDAFNQLIRHVQKDIKLNERRIIYLTGNPSDEHTQWLEQMYTSVTSTMYMSTLEDVEMDKFFRSDIRFETIGAIIAEYPKAAIAEYSLITLLGKSCAKMFECKGAQGYRLYGPGTALYRAKTYLALENPLDLLLALSEWIKNVWQMQAASDWLIRATDLTLKDGLRTPSIYDGNRLCNLEAFFKRVMVHLNEPIRNRQKRKQEGRV